MCAVLPIKESKFFSPIWKRTLILLRTPDLTFFRIFLTIRLCNYFLYYQKCTLYHSRTLLWSIFWLIKRVHMNLVLNWRGRYVWSIQHPQKVTVCINKFVPGFHGLTWIVASDKLNSSFFGAPTSLPRLQKMNLLYIQDVEKIK